MLADFGLAKTTDEKSVTITGSLLGTVRYLSPEQAMARRMRLDHRTDIYSLGATMYELLCFQPAFIGRDDKQILAAIMTRDPIRPRKVLAVVPRELETICLKSLEKAADKRYATARALAEDLRRYMQDMPIVAKRPGVATRIAKFMRRRKVTVIAVAVILAVGIPLWSVEHLLRGKAEIDRLVAAARSEVDIKAWSEAESKLKEALRRDPENYGAMQNLVWLRHEQWSDAGNDAKTEWLEEAAEVCGKLRDKDPTDAWALDCSGIYLRRLGRIDEATKVARLAIAADPTSYSAYTNLGGCLAITGELDEAEQQLNLATMKEGIVEGEVDLRAKTWRNLAALEHYRARPAALDHVNRAIELYKDDLEARILRARIHLTMKEHIHYEEALEEATHADQNANKKNAKVKRIRALAHLHLGQLERAIDHAQQAIRLDDLAPK